MKLTRSASAAASILAASALLLSACGSDNNTASTSAGGSSAPAVACNGKATLAAEGSSAQQNAMANFVAVYQGACPGKNLSYNASGSGTGRKQFIAGQVDFAGSDSAIKGDEATQAAARCKGGAAWNIPMVVGPIALAYNLPGVSDLTLNADVTAAIFNGGIKTWNDPKIAALNPGATLPSTAIAPQYRSDSSGTTDNFQTYLSDAAPTVWTQGAGSDFKGGAGQGSKGSSGVAQAVSATQGSIAYVEKSFSDQGKLSVAKLDNGGGATALSTEAVQKTLSSAKFTDDSNNLVVDLGSVFTSKEAGAYPLLLTTYEIVCSTGYDADTSGAVKAFLSVAANQGQSGLEAQGYVPLPSDFQSRVVKAVDAIA